MCLRDFRIRLKFKILPVVRRKMPGKVPRLGARSPPGGRGRLIGILRLRGISMGIRIDHLKKKFNPKLNPIILEIV